MRVFRNIVVMPTQALFGQSSGGRRDRGVVFRGGPLWPNFAFRLHERHRRGWLPFPVDRRPIPGGEPVRTVEAGIWCGPVTSHFGHMIADFSGRIAESCHRGEGLPLVFSTGPGACTEVPPFFHGLLEHFAVAPNRVLLVGEPTLFRSLAVVPQAERLRGRGPTRAYLDLLDRLVAAHGPAPRDIGLLFVSRSRFPDGRIAAEAYLDETFARAGGVVMHPESLDLATQLDHYRRARRIVFTEGSALHALQLLGHVEADVAVLVRRPGSRLARRHLRPRVRSLSYHDLIEHVVYARMPNGRPHANRALGLIDETALLGRMRDFGIDLAPHWDRAAYRERRDADLRTWIDYMRGWNLHPANRATITACLARAGVSIDLGSAWEP